MNSICYTWNDNFPAIFEVKLKAPLITRSCKYLLDLKQGWKGAILWLKRVYENGWRLLFINDGLQFAFKDGGPSRLGTICLQLWRPKSFRYNYLFLSFRYNYIELTGHNLPGQQTHVHTRHNPSLVRTSPHLRRSILSVPYHKCL